MKILKLLREASSAGVPTEIKQILKKLLQLKGAGRDYFVEEVSTEEAYLKDYAKSETIPVSKVYYYGVRLPLTSVVALSVVTEDGKVFLSFPLPLKGDNKVAKGLAEKGLSTYFKTFYGGPIPSSSIVLEGNVGRLSYKDQPTPPGAFLMFPASTVASLLNIPVLQKAIEEVFSKESLNVDEVRKALSGAIGLANLKYAKYSSPSLKQMDPKSVQAEVTIKKGNACFYVSFLVESEGEGNVAIRDIEGEFTCDWNGTEFSTPEIVRGKSEDLAGVIASILSSLAGASVAANKGSIPSLKKEMKKAGFEIEADRTDRDLFYIKERGAIGSLARIQVTFLGAYFNVYDEEKSKSMFRELQAISLPNAVVEENSQRTIYVGVSEVKLPSLRDAAKTLVDIRNKLYREIARIASKVLLK